MVAVSNSRRYLEEAAYHALTRLDRDCQTQLTRAINAFFSEDVPDPIDCMVIVCHVAALMSVLREKGAFATSMESEA